MKSNREQLYYRGVTGQRWNFQEVAMFVVGMTNCRGKPSDRKISTATYSFICLFIGHIYTQQIYI